MSACATGIPGTRFLVLSEGERDIVPTESERVVDRVLVISGPSTTCDDVEVDLGIEILQVECRRDDSIAQCHHGEDRLHCANRTDRVPERRLWRVHRGPMRTERVVD